MYKIATYIFLRALLIGGEESFVESVVQHLVDKLVKEKHSQGAQLLRGLSVLCEYQGDPIEQNQSEFYSVLLAM